MTAYPPVGFLNLSSLPDGEAVTLTGRYARHLGGAVLTQGSERLALLGAPFSWVPPQHTLVEVWGQVLQGARPRLLVHDARPRGAAAPVPTPSPQGHAGDSLILTVRVVGIGDEQFAVTADRLTFLLLGEELDERLYCLQGQVLTLDPPTLRLTWAVPFTVVAPRAPDAEA